MRNLSVIVGLLSASLIQPLHAETAYVTDILRLGLHAAQDTSDRPFETLVSGSELDVLQRVSNYAQVVTKDGTQGWVKSAYLVDDKPARLIVSETQAELDKLRTELVDAEGAKAASEAELNRIVSDANSKIGQVISMEQSIEELTVENETLLGRLNTYRGAVPGMWAAAAVLASLFGGFFLGLWALDAYVRHRHGGFRVY